MGGILSVFNPSAEQFSSFVAALDTIRFAAGQGVVFNIIRKSDTEVWVSTKQGMIAYDFEERKIKQELLNNPSAGTFSGHFSVIPLTARAGIASGLGFGLF